MDSISLFRDAARHKLATLGVLAVTVLLLLYVLVLRAPVYQADASYALVAPPAAPTASQLAKDPSLKNVNSYNPYANYGNLTVVTGLVTQAMSSQAMAHELKARGVTGFTVDQSSDNSEPIIEVSATGGSSAGAEAAAETVASFVKTTLANLQKQQHVATLYMITTQELNGPNYAQRKVSSTIRDAIAAVVFGLVLWFVVMSIVKGLELRREAQRTLAVADEPGYAGDSPRPTGDSDDSPGEVSPVAASTDGFQREPLSDVRGS